MYAQFFGNYLLSKKIITKEQLIQAMQKKASLHTKLGTLAIHAGYMTASEVDQVVILQTHYDLRFGELAIQEGYLTKEQVDELLAMQKPDFLLLGQALIELGVFDNEHFQNLLIDYESDNEFDDYSYSEETKESISRLLQNFFSTTDHSFTANEADYIRLLFSNLVRFIGDDFTPVSPYPCPEYPINYCVSQQIVGSFSLRTYVDMPENVCVEFASRYAREDFFEFDEYVQSSLEDFLNLHNGIFTVNMSNDYATELQLEPPVVETSELLSFKKETYLIPLVYPFGTMHFILEFSPKKYN